MKLAVLSDVHGNEEALAAVLDDIEVRRVDLVICLGDVVDPLPGSRATLETLKDLAVPILRGNHEDYVINAFEQPTHPVSTEVNFKPVRLVAQTFDKNLIKTMKHFPLTLNLNDTRAGEILFCHASPRSNLQGWRLGNVSPELGVELDREPADTIVCGHWHDPRVDDWNHKRLVQVGSVGIPLNGKPEAEYALITATDKGWAIEPRAVPFDAEKNLRTYRESGWVHEGGPIAWLIYDELMSFTRRMGYFVREWMPSRNLAPKTEAEWATAAELFLESTGTWEKIKKALAT